MSEVIRTVRAWQRHILHTGDLGGADVGVWKICSSVSNKCIIYLFIYVMGLGLSLAHSKYMRAQ